MKLSKFLLCISSCTLFAILYVYQQSEIFRLAYAGQKSAVEFQDLLDKNTVLRYNIESNASLASIGIKVSSAKEYEMPGTYQLVKVSMPAAQVKLSAPRKENALARFFSIKREAQAKTLNP